jgi:hypothetical protein
MSKTTINCFLIEPAENLILLLSKPYQLNNEYQINTSEIYNKWILNFIELFNNRHDFLLMAGLDIHSFRGKKEKILNKSYKQNYENVKENFDIIKQNNIEQHNGQPMVKIVPTNNSSPHNIVVNNDNKKLLENTVFCLLIFIFQYLNEFEKKSITTNLWNYCLKSVTFCTKSFVVGLVLLICQYIWIISLIYDVSNNLEINNDVSNNLEINNDASIIIVTIVSTIISAFYSYISINSYINSRPLYKFLLKVYDENTNLILKKEEKELIFYKERKINMKRWHIIYNWTADCLSNFILPIVLPFVNIFIIINSETIVDAILNCMAIFFIIQIDEEIYQKSDYKIEQLNINFTRWLIAGIYCKYIPEFEPIIKQENSLWQRLFKNCLTKYKKNSIKPISGVTN